jgi:hypothetical protein
MSINFLDDHLLYKIMNFIQDNKTSVNFILCCTYFKKLFYKYGYIKHIKTGNLVNISIYDFFLTSIKHQNTLNTIEITNVNNPMCWITVWPKVVFFNYCNITYEIKPFHQTKTKILYLLNNRNDKKIKVDWKMFPNLEYLEVDNFNFNFEDTKQCKKLLNIRIKNNITYNK